jgi:hypothetical protein
MQIPKSLVLVSAFFLICTAASAQLKAPRSSSAQGLAIPDTATLPSAAEAPAAPSKENAEKEAAGEATALAWLQQLDKREWRNAWQNTSQKFRATVPVATWMDAIPKTREPLGTLTERSSGQAIYKTTMPGQPDGEYVSVAFLSKFSNKPDAEEIVTTVREADGKWRVMGYQTR